jgi:diacylglycerol kinase (ATP)
LDPAAAADLTLDPLFIINPAAGTGGEASALEARVRARWPDAVWVETSGPGEAERLAKGAADHPIIVAAGGDGTINEVVNGIAGKNSCALAILPLGTGNDLARSLGIPTDAASALDLIDPTLARPIDLVRFMAGVARWFINVSAGGFSGAVDEKLTSEMKQTWGPLAYLRCAIAALPELTAHDTELVLDNSETLFIDACNIVVANGRYVAGGIPIAPDALLDDGMLDVLIFPGTTLPRLAALVPLMLVGRHAESDRLLRRRARRLSVHSEPGMWFNIDGELISNEPATFEVVPQALRVCAPADGPGFSRAAQNKKDTP